LAGNSGEIRVSHETEPQRAARFNDRLRTRFNTLLSDLRSEGLGDSTQFEFPTDERSRLTSSGDSPRQQGPWAEHLVVPSSGSFEQHPHPAEAAGYQQGQVPPPTLLRVLEPQGVLGSTLPPTVPSQWPGDRFSARLDRVRRAQRTRRMGPWRLKSSWNSKV